MFLNRERFKLFLMVSLFLFSCAPIYRHPAEIEIKREKNLALEAIQRANKCLSDNMSPNFQGPIPINSKVDSVTVDLKRKSLIIYLSKHFSYQPFRPETVPLIYDLFRKYLDKKFRQFDLQLFTLGRPIETLIPNFFRSDSSQFDRSRLPKESTRPGPPIVQCIEKRAWQPTMGLFNRNIALWHSHGYYYSRTKDRWEWMRPRLFNTVEDLLPMSFVIPYLVPMLENAGAIVFLPRERDLQTEMVIIDNDSPLKDGQYREKGAINWQSGDSPGFKIGTRPYLANFNPFLQGSYRFCLADSINSAQAEWIPDIPATGEYGVYISYHHSLKNIPDAHYTVYHSAGKTEFRVNQQMGGSTWIYLGQFRFKQGVHPDSGRVVLTNDSQWPGQIVSADAVRFGGGMGDIIRGGTISGYPRFAEAARYYLQFAGMPDTLVYHLNKDTTDYNDDYQSRGEFVNYLKGRPFGPNRNRDAEGLGIPIDLSLAFHTDAGIAQDSTIGTLMIYSITDAETLDVFPDGMSRLVNRDLGDILQTQIVEDIRRKYRPDWARRDLRDANYSEAWRPNVPACLLELLSHQNFTDMQYALWPLFRFDVARAIYKGILKFLATQYRFRYAVQPLPVSHFHAWFSDSAEVTLRWQPVIDPLEPTAAPEKYVVYTRIDSAGFDNGTLLATNQFTKNELKPGTIYSFKVTAVNSGGESFPSEILSVCWMTNDQSPVLIINGFDRIAAPEYINEPNFKGFANFLDPGVADKFTFNLTGAQFDFDPQSRFRSNDAPGHGASSANYETQLIAGNSFDYPFIHGSAIRACGYSFVSSSDEAVWDGQIDLKNYRIIDLILGEEKALFVSGMNLDNNPYLKINQSFKAFPEKLRNNIISFLKTGGKLFLSGAYIGSELAGNKDTTQNDIKFAKEVLNIDWQTNHAAVTGKVCAVDSSFLQSHEVFRFNTEYRPDLYAVESPDAIDPVPGTKTILRYAENRFSAGTAYLGNDFSVIALGFPFETIIDPTWRIRLMEAVLRSFNQP
ncbi:MAG: fibronectin type III domain-containing protein [candidate division KSB1 bacterium]|nr:fibronectin type III domain-containing protein [candidate division KSB1 bacterium]MDZ7357103.1 fibronectin type III domain-containing protein [candidate division KSB1 bacterium]MDZ7401773.1 fibronectin type III domain-containing protein [candidate division KSB1 bacterium]